MKKFIKKFIIYVSACALVFTLAALVGAMVKELEIPDADDFARNYARVVLDNDFSTARSMMHIPLDGTNTMADVESKFISEWATLQVEIENDLFNGQTRSKDKIERIVESLECGDIKCDTRFGAVSIYISSDPSTNKRLFLAVCEVNDSLKAINVGIRQHDSCDFVK